jgi:sugar phosphate permease
MDKEKALSQLKKYRLPILIVVILAFMLTPFNRQAPAVMGPELIKDLGLNAVDFGLMGLSFMWAYALMNAPLGNLLDQFGVRRGLSVLLIMIGLGSFIFCAAQTFLVAVIGRIIVAIAVAGCFIAGVKVITNWYSAKEFPSIYGLYLGLAMLGGVGATGPLQFMMTNYGWRYSFAVIGVISISLAVIAYFVVKDRPADVALPSPDEITGEAVPVKNKEEAKASGWEVFKEVCRMPKLWLANFFILGVNSSGQAIVALWGGVFLANVYGFSKPVVAEILMVSATGLIIGSFAAGWLVKKLGSVNVMLSGTVLFLIGWLYMTLNIRTLSTMELKILFAAFGFLQQYSVVGYFSLMRELVQPSQMGTATGLNNGFVWVVGAGAFQQIWGLVINHISKGVTPYPVEAFEAALWLQVFVVAISICCGLYLVKMMRKPTQVISANR